MASQNSIEGFILIAGFFQLILIFVFLHMAGNIDALRVRFTAKNPDTWLKKYNKSRYLKRDAEALFNLQEFIWESLQRKKSQSKYQSLKEQYESAFIKLGSEFPEYPFTK